MPEASPKQTHNGECGSATGIVITGLPASGKSSLGRELAPRLGLQLLDKDDYLEALFAQRGIGDARWRQKLSRESDSRFRQDAQQLGQAILVSHWRPRGVQSQSGTPVEWLDETFPRLIEVCCECTVESAVQRFFDRHRHAGHCDTEKTPAQVSAWFEHYSRQLPLGLGPLLSVVTEGDVAIDEICRRLQAIQAVTN